MKMCIKLKKFETGTHIISGIICRLFNKHVKKRSTSQLSDFIFIKCNTMQTWQNTLETM